MPFQDLLGRRGLGLEDGPVGNIAVPLNQRRDGTAFSDDDIVQLPDCVSDRAIVTIDEEEFTFVVGLLGMAGEMDFADPREREV